MTVGRWPALGPPSLVTMVVGEVFLLLVSLTLEVASLELEDQTLGLDLTKGWTQQDFVRTW